MPTQKPRCTITFEDEQLKDMVEAFRFDNRYKSQNDAIMALINRGIEVLTGEMMSKPKEELSIEEKRLLRAYRAAEPSAQQHALAMLESFPAAKEKHA